MVAKLQAIKTSGGIVLKAASVSHQRVRAVVQCSDCLKVRCLYSWRMLTAAQKESLEVLLDSLHYSCGSVVVPVGHSLYGVVYSDERLLCAAPVSSAFYTAAARLDEKAEICAHCSSEDDLIDITALKTQFAVVLPCCRACVNLKPICSKPVQMAASKRSECCCSVHSGCR